MGANPGVPPGLGGLRVGAWAPYPEEGPSTRYRLAQFVRPLAERGIHLEILPFMDSSRYRGFYRASTIGRGRVLLGGWSKRFLELGRRRNFDVWIVHRELAPLGNRVLEARLRRTGLPYVFDFDDAIYLPPPGGSPGIRRIRRPEADARRFARNAAAVFAGNAELARFASAARGGAGDGVHLVPTVIDTERFAPVPGPRAGPSGARPVPSPLVPEGPAPGTAVLGWVGTHTTAPYLEPLVPTLRALMREVPFTVRVISNGEPPWLARAGPGFEYLEWSGEREVERIRDFTVGLYPLDDTPWERGKCGLKAIQYMACGVPVVGSRVGVLGRVVPDGEGGLLVDPGGDWSRPLRDLLRDPEKRTRMGEKGRAWVEREYSVTSLVDRMAELLRSVVPGPPGSRST